MTETTKSFAWNCLIVSRGEVLFSDAPGYYLNGYAIIPGEQYADLLETRGTPLDLENASSVRAMTSRAMDIITNG